MCFFTQQIAIEKNVRHRFNAEIENKEHFLKSDYINGFAHPNIPIILDSSPNIITTDHTWGLLPFWAQSEEFIKKTNTLNAKIETIEKKPSYKKSTENRCLIIATGFHEWHWNDPKGLSKDKYIIKSEEDEIFTFAGIYTTWRNPSTQEEKKTYTMVTTEANEIMSYIHNHKKRMPIMLRRKDELAWLDKSVDMSEFAYPNYDVNLVTTPKISNEQYGLF